MSLASLGHWRHPAHQLVALMNFLCLPCFTRVSFGSLVVLLVGLPFCNYCGRAVIPELEGFLLVSPISDNVANICAKSVFLCLLQ